MIGFWSGGLARARTLDNDSELRLERKNPTKGIGERQSALRIVEALLVEIVPGAEYEDIAADFDRLGLDERDREGSVEYFGLFEDARPGGDDLFE